MFFKSMDLIPQFFPRSGIGRAVSGEIWQALFHSAVGRGRALNELPFVRVNCFVTKTSSECHCMKSMLLEPESRIRSEASFHDKFLRRVR